MPTETYPDPSVSIYNSFTLATADGFSKSFRRPSDAVEWLRSLRLQEEITTEEAKRLYAESATMWSGVEVSTISAWRFILDLQEADYLTITWNKNTPIKT